MCGDRSTPRTQCLCARKSGNLRWHQRLVWRLDMGAGNPLAATGDTPDAARSYLAGVLGTHFDAERVDAFLAASPPMVRFFHENTRLRFDLGVQIPDTYSDLPSAGQGSRSVIAKPFDLRALGADVKRLAAPLRETTFLGMTIQSGPDLKAFLTTTRSLRSAAYVSRRVACHLWEVARYGRGMQARNGLALVGRLLSSALERDVRVQTQSPVARLLTESGRVIGVETHHASAYSHAAQSSWPAVGFHTTGLVDRVCSNGTSTI